MPKVRFIKRLSAVPDIRVAYTLHHPEPIIAFDEVRNEYCLCWDTKELGCISVDRMEITDDPTDVQAVDVLINLHNKRLI